MESREALSELCDKVLTAVEETRAVRYLMRKYEELKERYPDEYVLLQDIFIRSYFQLASDWERINAWLYQFGFWRKTKQIFNFVSINYNEITTQAEEILITLIRLIY